MTSSNNSSQLSEISGISHISRSNSSRPVRTDSASSLSYQITALPEHGKNTGITEAEKLNDELSKCEDDLYDYAQNKFIYDCVREVSENTDKTLSEATAKKLKQVLSVHVVERYLHLPNGSKDLVEDLTLLGITNADLPNTTLAYEETMEIKAAVEAKLRVKIKDFISRYERLGGNMDELLKNDEKESSKKIPENCEIDLLHSNDKIEEVCMQYEKDLFDYGECLNRWVELKHNALADMHHKKAENLLVKAQIAQVQAETVKLTCTLRMFKEIPKTVEAFQILDTTLDRRIAELREEIKQKEALKKSYAELEGTEYDEVLKKYQELCKAIEKKRQIIDKFMESKHSTDGH